MNLIISLEAHLICHHQKDCLFHLANHRRYLDLYHHLNCRQIYSYYFSKKCITSLMNVSLVPVTNPTKRMMKKSKSKYAVKIWHFFTHLNDDAVNGWNRTSRKTFYCTRRITSDCIAIAFFRFGRLSEHKIPSRFRMLLFLIDRRDCCSRLVCSIGLFISKETPCNSVKS